MTVNFDLTIKHLKLPIKIMFWTILLSESLWASYSVIPSLRSGQHLAFFLSFWTERKRSEESPPFPIKRQRRISSGDPSASPQGDM